MAITTTVRPTFANGPSAGRFRKTAAVSPGFATTGLPPTFGRPSVPGTWVPLDPDRSGAVESERRGIDPGGPGGSATDPGGRSEEHTSELQSLRHLVCRLLLEKK